MINIRRCWCIPGQIPVDFAFFGSNEIENEIKNCVSGRKGEGEAEQMGKWRLLWSLRYQNGLFPLNYF